MFGAKVLFYQLGIKILASIVFIGSTLSYSLAPKKTLNLIDYKSSNDKNKAELNPQSNKRSKDIPTKESSLITHQFKNKSR